MRPKPASKKQRTSIPHPAAAANRDDADTIVDGFGEKIVAIDADGKLAHLSSSAEELLAKDGVELIGPKASELMSGASGSPVTGIDAVPLPMLPAASITFYTAKLGTFQTTWVGGNIESLTGFNSERFLLDAHFWASQIHPDDREAVFKVLNKVAEKQVVSVEYRWQCADGDYRWFSNRAVLTRDADGKADTISGTWTDITQLKSIENQKEMFVSLAESSDDFICLASIEGKPFFLNQAGRRLVGINGVEQMNSVHLSDLCTPDTWTAIRDYALPSTLAERRWEGEGQLCGLNGVPVDVHISTIPIISRNETTQCVAVVTRDITERKKASAALLESKARLELINGIASELRSAAPVERIIGRTLELIGNRFPALRIAFFGVGDDGEVVTARSVQPEGIAPLASLPAALSRTAHFLESLRNGEPVVVEDVMGEGHPAGEVRRAETGKGAVLAVPLIHLEKLIGVLCCDAPETRKWPESEVATLKEAAEYLTIAIVETRRHEEHERAEEEVRERDSIIRGDRKSTRLNSSH